MECNAWQKILDEKKLNTCLWLRVICNSMMNLGITLAEGIGKLGESKKKNSENQKEQED